ncbi:hypothetical protein ACIA8O_38780 [Kitasatospora sp. NPDC051853]|uniref:hypothetical protein n=1 Tax=Kitasatospora sp. NPDC051853 TaxID=3364058 RepID=UPI00379DA2D9
MTANDCADTIERRRAAHRLDAEQLAADARRYADRLADGQPDLHDADRLADLGARVARQAHHLDGMREIARILT